MTPAAAGLTQQTRPAELIERAINGVELPDYAGVADSGAVWSRG